MLTHAEYNLKLVPVYEKRVNVEKKAIAHQVTYRSAKIQRARVADSKAHADALTASPTDMLAAVTETVGDEDTVLLPRTTVHDVSGGAPVGLPNTVFVDRAELQYDAVPLPEAVVEGVAGGMKVPLGVGPLALLEKEGVPVLET